MNYYKVYYKNTERMITANSQYEAKLKALENIKPSKKDRNLISVCLVAKGDKQVVHTPDF